MLLHRCFILSNKNKTKPKLTGECCLLSIWSISKSQHYPLLVRFSFYLKAMYSDHVENSFFFNFAHTYIRTYQKYLGVMPYIYTQYNSNVMVPIYGQSF